jgi:subtilisin
MAEEYILLPGRRLQVPLGDSNLMNLIAPMGGARSTAPPLSFELPHMPPFKVIDSVHENGPKLIEVEADVSAVRSARSLGLRLEPVLRYTTSDSPKFNPNSVANASSSPLITVTVVSKSTKNPIPGALVTAFTQFAAREGAEDITDGNGQCKLSLGQAVLTLDRVYVYPPLSGFWGSFQTSVVCNGILQLELEPIQLPFVDALAHFYGSAQQTDGEHVRVGIIDTGIDNTHPDLAHVQCGANTARGEDAKLWQDNGTGHGTHVAGIIGARNAVRNGIAPAVEICSYRAFPANSEETTNYQLMKGLIRAMDDGCHLINMSVSAEARPDLTLRSAIEDAHDKGILVVVSAGNGSKTQVGYPAFYAFQDGLSVSAMGRQGTFPVGSYEESNVGSPLGRTDANNFVARFTNTGDVSLIAPGVGIISTVPGGYGVMSGTSMACPAVTGMAARLLSKDLVQNGLNAILNQNADASRTVAMMNLMSKNAIKLFQDSKVEGDGLVS